MRHKITIFSVFFTLCILAGVLCTSVLSAQDKRMGLKVVVIDAGHGGEDGGATSCCGFLESDINLEISLRLNDLLNFLGHRTIMVRTEDVSVHTEGQTIAQRKVSDLKNRVQLVNETENALLVSIHQNYFADSRYSGAQVFCADSTGSRKLAEKIQNALQLIGVFGAVEVEPGLVNFCVTEKVSKENIDAVVGYLNEMEV